MPSETTELLEQLKSVVEQSTRAANAASAAANASTQAVHQLGKKFDTMSERVDQITKRVYGSDPPESGGESLPPLDDSVDRALTKAEKARLEVGDLRDEMRAGFSTMTKKMEAQGMGAGWLPDMKTPEGRNFTLRVLTMVFAAVGAWYGMSKGIAPAPPAPAPTFISPAAASSK